MDNLHPQEQDLLIAACREQILKHYKMLGVVEVKDAFEMFASNKLNIDIQFYGGRFKVPHLGKILNAYLVKRKNYISTYENQVNLLDWRKPKPEEIIKEKNSQTVEVIKNAYNSLVLHFKENGDINYLEKEIRSHWGEILVKEGVISFTLEEKVAIVEECKQYVAKQIENQLLSGKTDIYAKKGLKTIKQAFEAKEHNSDFKGKWEARYKKLIVIKSILNS